MHASQQIDHHTQVAHPSDGYQTLTIRKATPADAFLISDMGRRLLPAAHLGATPGQEIEAYVRQFLDIGAVTQEIQAPSTRFWLAQSHGQVGGMVKMSHASIPGGIDAERPVELSRLYLEKFWIGHGVGSRLMQHALKQAAKDGYAVCWLTVWTGNGRALDFYRRWGFQIAQTTSYALATAELPIFIMVRSLKTLNALVN